MASRSIVDWLVAERESTFLATRMIEQQIVAAGIDANQLAVHSDRGAPMTSRTMAQMLADLGVERSLSRPRVSNDNPFSEAQFKTMKYGATWPTRFASLHHAREWASSFVQWYNHEHRHEGIGLFTPADVHAGRHLQLDAWEVKVRADPVLAAEIDGREGGRDGLHLHPRRRLDYAGVDPPIDCEAMACEWRALSPVSHRNPGGFRSAGQSASMLLRSRREVLQSSSFWARTAETSRSSDASHGKSVATRVRFRSSR